MWARNFDQEFNSWLFKLAAALIDYWMSNCLQEQSISHWRHNILPNLSFCKRQPITTPSPKPLSCLLQSCFLQALTDSCLWRAGRWLTDPDVLIGRCQTSRHDANADTCTYTYTCNGIRVEEQSSLEFKVDALDFACESVCSSVSKPLIARCAERYNLYNKSMSRRTIQRWDFSVWFR